MARTSHGPHRKMVWGLAVVVGLVGGASVAWSAVSDLFSEYTYEVEYAANESKTRVLRNVRIVEVTRLGRREFLVIEPRGSARSAGSTARGYINLEHVRAILPGIVFGTKR